MPVICRGDLCLSQGDVVHLGHVGHGGDGEGDCVVGRSRADPPKVTLPDLNKNSPSQDQIPVDQGKHLKPEQNAETNQVTICWIKAHVGQSGNEHADHEAKLGSEAELLEGELPAPTSKGNMQNASQNIHQRSLESGVARQ